MDKVLWLLLAQPQLGGWDISLLPIEGVELQFRHSLPDLESLKRDRDDAQEKVQDIARIVVKLVAVVDDARALVHGDGVALDHPVKSGL